MTRLIFALAFALGVAAIVWTASIFIGSNNLALAVTAMIAVAFALGFYELANFRGATASLLTALDQLPGSEDGDLDRWIGALHPSLQNAVRQRIEGERLGLPAPFITPYLVGLLVMLGLLGTFVGMVDTLQGAVFALEGTTELQAIRAGLAAPINGLSLAFGTSVAGVAASAMLGLASTLSRRERMLATRELDSRAAKELPELSLSHNRKETYRVMQMQAQALPEVAQRLERLADSLETMGDRLGEKLLENQNQFHDSVDARYSALATSVDSSLQESLSSSARAAADSIRPIIADTMSSIEQHAKSTHGALSEVAQVQLETLSESFTRSSESVASSWQNSDRERLAQWSAAFNEAQTSSVSHLSDTAKLVAQELRDITTAQQASFSTATEDFQTLATALNTGWVETGQNMQGQVSAFSAELNALREEEQQRNVSAGESLAKLEATAASHLSQLEATAANHLSALGKELEQPMTRLIETASETPKAAAEVIGHLRNEITANIERDNQLLQERQQIMEQLNTVAASLTESTSAQHEVVEKMISGSAVVLESAGNRFSEQLDGVTGALTESSSAQHKAVKELVGSSAQILETAGNRFGEQLNGVTDALTESSSTQNKAVEQLIGSSAEILENAGNRFGEQLSGVADSLTESSTAQQQAVDQLLGGSAKILDTAGTRFSEQLEREGEKFTGIADNVAASSGDMISLSETFALAVELFNQSNSSLIEQLASIEESMTDTTSRSDEQMAYYVAQAREIIDQSLLSQREVFEELRQLKDANPVAAEAS